MIVILIAMMLTTGADDDGAPVAPPGAVDGKSIVDLLESIQPQLEDFRCEFEGTDVEKTDAARKESKLKDDGLADSFGGTYVWKANGDTYLICYHREEPEGKVRIEQLAVRIDKHEAETYQGYVDDATGEGIIDDPDLVTSDRPGSIGSLFVLDKIRRLASSPDFYCTTTDDVFDGSRVKVVTFTFHNRDKLYRRFWIDLKRGGQAVREEVYGEGGALWVRVNITLAPFRVGDTKIWMPISGVIEGYNDEKDGKPIYLEAPTSVETIYIIRGTLEFNRRPGLQTFKVAYRPGTLISDNLRKLQSEFGQQKLPPLPSRRESAEMLRKQVDEAEAQRRELTAGSPARDASGWASWLPLALAVSTLVLSVIVLIQRRRH